MEVLTKINPRYFWYAGIGLLTLVLVGLLIYLGITILSPRKAGAPTPVVAASTAQAAAKPTQAAATAARTVVPEAATATPVPPTPVPPTAAATSKPANPPAPAQPKPGVYVTKLDMNQTRLASNEEPVFSVTFVNTTGSPVDYKWFVYIYRQGATKPMGQTNAQKTYIPTGTNVLPAQNWHTNAKGACEPYFAQVVYDDGGPVPFRTTDGKIASVSFNVCK